MLKPLLFFLLLLFFTDNLILFNSGSVLALIYKLLFNWSEFKLAITSSPFNISSDFSLIISLLFSASKIGYKQITHSSLSILSLKAINSSLVL